MDLLLVDICAEKIVSAYNNNLLKEMAVTVDQLEQWVNGENVVQVREVTYNQERLSRIVELIRMRGDLSGISPPLVRKVDGNLKLIDGNHTVNAVYQAINRNMVRERKIPVRVVSESFFQDMDMTEEETLLTIHSVSTRMNPDEVVKTPMTARDRRHLIEREYYASTYAPKGDVDSFFTEAYILLKAKDFHVPQATIRSIVHQIKTNVLRNEQNSIHNFRTYGSFELNHIKLDRENKSPDVAQTVAVVTQDKLWETFGKAINMMHKHALSDDDNLAAGNIVFYYKDYQSMVDFKKQKHVVNNFNQMKQRIIQLAEKLKEDPDYLSIEILPCKRQ